MELLPTFETAPFRADSDMGQHPDLQLVVRRPMDGLPGMAVGHVFRDYSLVQHAEAVGLIACALQKVAELDPRGLRGELSLSAFGEWTEPHVLPSGGVQLSGRSRLRRRVSLQRLQLRGQILAPGHPVRLVPQDLLERDGHCGTARSEPGPSASRSGRRPGPSSRWVQGVRDAPEEPGELAGRTRGGRRSHCMGRLCAFTRGGACRPRPAFSRSVPAARSPDSDAAPSASPPSWLARHGGGRPSPGPPRGLRPSTTWRRRCPEWLRSAPTSWSGSAGSGTSPNSSTASRSRSRQVRRAVCSPPLSQPVR